MIKSTDIWYVVIILGSIHKNRNINLSKPNKKPTTKPVKTCYLEVGDSQYLNLTKLNF